MHETKMSTQVERNIENADISSHKFRNNGQLTTENKNKHFRNIHGRRN